MSSPEESSPKMIKRTVTYKIASLEAGFGKLHLDLDNTDVFIKNKLERLSPSQQAELAVITQKRIEMWLKDRLDASSQTHQTKTFRERSLSVPVPCLAANHLTRKPVDVQAYFSKLHDPSVYGSRERLIRSEGDDFEHNEYLAMLAMPELQHKKVRRSSLSDLDTTDSLDESDLPEMDLSTATEVSCEDEEVFLQNEEKTDKLEARGGGK